ncbi:4057_t:CDS:2 [Acaulospora colombiana]|uniref:4057_t:CDS:1 n=1 Tax=Acaulospora colombiana TaxID=27376 RepID=A0ACA9N4H5_9GLOM|nr:4057_t:CDS:2 [Acaulospora colombiana]
MVVRTTISLPIITLPPTGTVSSIELSTSTGSNVPTSTLPSNNRSDIPSSTSSSNRDNTSSSDNSGDALNTLNDSGNISSIQSSSTATIATITPLIGDPNTEIVNSATVIDSSATYRRRKRLLGEGSNEGFMREVGMSEGNGSDKSSLNSENLGDEFNYGNGQSFFGGALDNSIGFSAASGYNQGDIADAHGVNLTTDDPFADTASAYIEDTSLFRNASSDVIKDVRARKLPKIKTHNLAGMFANDNEFPEIQSTESFNFHGAPFQNNEHSHEVEPRPMLRPTLSRTPTVVSAFSELIEPFLPSQPPVSPSSDSSIKDIRNVIMSASGNLGSTTGGTEYSPRSPLSNIDSDELPVSEKDDETGSKWLAEELSTALTISSAIESTALPILSTFDNGVFEESEPRGDLNATGRSHDNTEELHDDIEQSRADIVDRLYDNRSSNYTNIPEP